MTINATARTISLTKKEMTAARRVGTPEYKELQTARRDYPGFAVNTITRKINTQCEIISFVYTIIPCLNRNNNIRIKPFLGYAYK